MTTCVATSRLISECDCFWEPVWIEKRQVTEMASLFDWLVCSLLLTCVRTAHRLPRSICSSFAGHCERKHTASQFAKRHITQVGRLPNGFQTRGSLSAAASTQMQEGTVGLSVTVRSGR